MKNQLPDFCILCWKMMLAILVSFFLVPLAQAQKMQLILGNPEIAQNEYFTITISIQDGSLDDFENFPNIPGFSKAGTSSKSSMQSINGRVSQEYSLIQNYMPEKQGVFTLAPFSVKVNGRILKSPGCQIKVGPAGKQQNSSPFGNNPFAFDPFEDFYGNQGGGSGQELKADAFFRIQTDKKEVWAGEGFNVTVSFFVSEDNQAELSFYDIGNQLTGFVKKIKPANCWEENFGIEEIQQRRLKIGAKDYTEYRIYEATLYPLTPGIITIPALKLDMLAQSGGFFGRGKEEIKSFFSKEIRLKVRDLPPHPLKEKVSVGRFQLEEKASRDEIFVQKGYAYDFIISGEGNISYIREAEEQKSALLDIYPPNSRQSIQRSGGRVTGSKTFSYLILPREPGTIRLDETLYWVFFNTATSKYDTLKPKTVIRVKKGKKSTASAAARTEDSFYSLLEGADTRLADLSERKSASLLWYNLAMAAMALICLVFMLRKT